MTNLQSGTGCGKGHGLWVDEGETACTLTGCPFLLGTIMMSGCGILTNGKGTRREYCEFSLDELQVSVSLSSVGQSGEPGLQAV